MATAIGTIVLYKTNKDFVPAILLRAYSDAVGTGLDNVANDNTGITHADLLVLGVAPVRLSNVAKETAVAGTDGKLPVSGTSTALTDIASMATGKWFTLT
jgi:hypothetical protein